MDYATLFGDIKTQVLAGYAVIVPIALAIMAVPFVVKRGIGLFKSTSR